MNKNIIILIRENLQINCCYYENIKSCLQFLFIENIEKQFKLCYVDNPTFIIDNYNIYIFHENGVIQLKLEYFLKDLSNNCILDLIKSYMKYIILNLERNMVLEIG